MKDHLLLALTISQILLTLIIIALLIRLILGGT
ncbi:hypothetical protein ES703_25470 [subsurface metagenome]